MPATRVILICAGLLTMATAGPLRADVPVAAAAPGTVAWIADAPWPKYKHDLRNTGNILTPIRGT